MLLFSKTQINKKLIKTIRNNEIITEEKLTQYNCIKYTIYGQ